MVKFTGGPSCSALRIHMSDNTAEILKRLGGYDLQCRGQREVKVCVCVPCLYQC